MIVVDSSVWIAWLRDIETPETGKLATVHPSRIVVGDIVFLEVLRGARDERQAHKLENDLRQYEIVPMLDDRSAAKAGGHYRRLRSLGYTIRKVPDLIIGTFCIEHNHQLLQADRDFTPMVQHLGLRLA